MLTIGTNRFFGPFERFEALRPAVEAISYKATCPPARKNKGPCKSRDAGGGAEVPTSSAVDREQRVFRWWKRSTWILRSAWR
jgi:hypothetical protein